MHKFAGKLARVLTLMAVAALPLARPAKAADVIKLKYATFMPPTHPMSLLSEQWGKELEKRTNGRVQVSFVPGGTLVSANQTYDSVVKGVVDVGWSVVAYTQGRMPLTEGFLLPLGFKSAVQATRVLDAYYTKFRPKEFDDVKILYLHTHGPADIHSKKAITRLDDLKGLRIKGNGDNARILAALGAVATTMPMLELYDSIKRGVAEGAFLP
ncbi:MAG: TRAP transporter substrate-binding protein DctP, partial [Desulfovibrio sp.]|nr:TRAP transporter substrate-binding protein DctP [Desulfovibrio sp.]